MDYTSPDSIYNLLPAVYRIRDAERGYPLQAFLRIIAGQVKITKEDIDRLWDNFFIETCDDWVIPYIGDLVGSNPLHDIERPNRADVAKTIYYRRRKGTLPMLEELARDVTGWGCHAVEFFERLEWTQDLNHLRLPSQECVDMRNVDALDLVNTPFDSVSHTVDVRSINQIEGWHNLRNIGFFLWRLQSYPLENVPPRPVKETDPQGCYYFSTLGNPCPLFQQHRREGDEAGVAGEIHVPTPIRPRALGNDLKCVREALARGEVLESEYIGNSEQNSRSLSIRVLTSPTAGETETQYVPPEAIVCMDLQDWQRPTGTYQERLTSGGIVEKPFLVGIDVGRGRFAFAHGHEPQSGERIEVSYHYGFSANIGGGPYPRQEMRFDSRELPYTAVVAGIRPENVPLANWQPTLRDALITWKKPPNPNNKAIITIADHGIYTLSSEDPDLFNLSANQQLIIQAATQKRPTLRFLNTANMVSVLTITGAKGTSLCLNGLLIEGGIQVTTLDHLKILHCTLTPGLALDAKGDPMFPKSASLRVEAGSSWREVEIDHSITGLLRLPEDNVQLTICDSIIDAFGGAALSHPDPVNQEKVGPPTSIERTTVLGAVRVKELTLANAVIFNGEVFAERTQAGCVRFSCIPGKSRTPRQFHCQMWPPIIPAFTSVHFGDPAYCQLSRLCPAEITTGAEDGSEIGAFCHLRQPQREANLRIRLEEYLPCGLQPGFIFIT